ncbi:extracellular solute-binding protein [Actinotalea sp. BY-33]|uniref:Extracellular solute-binding protein n=1 Tax=Actinotalea soli TaxID=2819234 RepID=A0A939RSN0_9CELL|nr:extracellular solute-binding protein [Actinotalea soli]MBO1751927.1 extracellular solute-binding protein [Actinotalea soli]
MVLVGCGGEDGPPTLTWYTNPDAGGQAVIAQRCTEEADGAYRIEVSTLPREASEQRQQLARRLAAEDASIDLMSLDPPFIPEFANAGFLAEIPAEMAERVSEDVVAGALAGATWEDELVTVPFWANTQLLWYRESVVEEAGLDMSEPVTWDQLIEVAQEQDLVLGVQGTKAESMTVWINALVASAGGTIVENPEAPTDEITLGLDSEAGREAARIMGEIGGGGLGGPGLPTADENANLSVFQGDRASFMVNWPFVWTATVDAVDAGTLDAEVLEDFGWAIYPQVVEGEESRPPYGGINIGVGAFSNHTDLALEAAECVVAPENQAEYFATNGNPPASTAAYDDPAVQDAFPMADLIRESLEQAEPRPQTPFYNEVSTGLQETWHPASAVSDSTPASSADFITAVLRGERLL